MNCRMTTWVLLMAGLSAPLAAQLVASHEPTATAASASVNAGSQPGDRPVARVNGAVLTDRDLLREMYAIFPYARQHNGGFPPAMEADIRKGALQMIVFEELVYQEALRRGLTIPAAKLDQAVAEFRKQFRSPSEFQDFMRYECRGSQKVLRARVQRSLLIEQVLKTEVTDKSAVSMAQTRAFYDKNLALFRTPESFSLQTISILPPANATPAQLKEVRKRAEDALRQAKATTDYETFGVLAEKISEDDYRVMMGDHHAVDRDKLPPQVAAAAQAMKPGQISDLVQVEQAYTIIRLNAHNSAGIQKFEDVKDLLRKQLRQQKTEQLRVALDRKLRANAKVEEL